MRGTTRYRLRQVVAREASSKLPVTVSDWVPIFVGCVAEPHMLGDIFAGECDLSAPAIGARVRSPWRV